MKVKVFSTILFLGIVAEICAAFSYEKNRFRTSEYEYEYEYEDEGEDFCDPILEEFQENPEICFSYFQCDSDLKYVCRLCPLPTVWSQEEKNCTFPRDGRKCNVSSVDKYVKQVCKGTGNCANLYFKNPKNCSQYYQCDNGEPLLRDCSPGTVWSNCVGNCVHRTETETGCAEDLCGAGCITGYYPYSEEEVEIPGKYYECFEGVPYVRDCPTGMSWCEDTPPCCEDHCADCFNKEDERSNLGYSSKIKNNNTNNNNPGHAKGRSSKNYGI